MEASKGFTLVEAAVTLGVAAILAAVVAPSFGDALERARLKSAAEDQASKLYLAKAEALRSGQAVFYSVKAAGAGAGGCYGFRKASPCDCAQQDATAAEACTLARVDLGSLQGARASSTFSSEGGEHIDPVRGTVSHPGAITLTSPSGYILRVGVTSVGRVYLCTPAGAGRVPGYSTNGC